MYVTRLVRPRCLVAWVEETADVAVEEAAAVVSQGEDSSICGGGASEGGVLIGAGTVATETLLAAG